MVERARGTIIFTGATASLRGKEGFAAFSSAKHAKRALAQSMARELMPKGIHVVHVVIDGAIDTPWVNNLMGKEITSQMRKTNNFVQPDEIAKNYVMLSEQKRNAWTHELDLRPWGEKW